MYLYIKMNYKTLGEYINNNYLQRDISNVTKLLNNPISPFSFLKNISIADHERLHILLHEKCNKVEQQYNLNINNFYNERAFTLGVFMGINIKANRFHLILYCLFSKSFYLLSQNAILRLPIKQSQNVLCLPVGHNYDYKFFKAGFAYGKKILEEEYFIIDYIKLSLFDNCSLDIVREYLGLELKTIRLYQNIFTEHRNRKYGDKYIIDSRILKISSSILAITGGFF